MSLHNSIHTFLSSKTEITAVVGNKIWRKHRQTTALPCIVFFSPTSKPVQQIDRTTEITYVTIQFDIYSLDDEQTISLTNSLRNLLNGFNGEMEGTEIINIKFHGDHDTSIPPADSSGNWMYKRSADFTFKIRM